MEIRVGGVYNSDIIKFLCKKDIKHFKFDFRPRSFTFTQIEKVQSILEETKDLNISFSLCFDDEDKDFTIKETCKRFKDISSQFHLEFYQAKQELDYYESFETNYYLHIGNDWKPSKGTYLQKLILDYKDLQQLVQFNQAYQFLNSLQELVGMERVEVYNSWGDQPLKTIFDFYRFSSISADINSLVESSYRSVNFDLLEQGILGLRRFTI